MAAPAKHSCCNLTWMRGISSPLPFLSFSVGLLLLVATLALGATPGLRQSAYQILALQLSPHPPAPPTCTPNKRSNHLSSRTKPLSILSTFYSSTVPVSEVNERSQVSQSFSTLCDPMDCSLTRFLRPWDFPGKNIGVGCHFLFQEIFPTQGLNPRLMFWQTGSLPLSHREANCQGR